MPANTLAELTTYLEELQLHGRPRPVLLMGAGASKSAGLAAMEDLFVRVGLDPKDPAVPGITLGGFASKVVRKQRLCRLMCGRPLAFREVRLKIPGCAHFSGVARVFCSTDGSAERFRTSDGRAAASSLDF
jgi:hypothetical protein